MKDTNNLIPYNTWSGGEYNKSITELVRTNGQKVSITDTYSSMGEYSFKVERISNEYVWTEYRAIGNHTKVQGKSTIYTPISNSSLIIIFYYTDNSHSAISCDIPASNKSKIVTLTAESNPDKTVDHISLRISVGTLNHYCYWDDLSLKSL